MLPNSDYSRELDNFINWSSQWVLHNNFDLDKGVSSPSEVQRVQSILRHIYFAKPGWDVEDNMQQPYGKLVELLRNIWEPGERNETLNGSQVKKALDSISNTEWSDESIWFQLAVLSYRMRTDVWSGGERNVVRRQRDPKLIHHILMTWPIDRDEEDRNFPGDGHMAAVMYERVRAVRSENDLEADLWAQKGEERLSGSPNRDFGTIYGMLRYSDFKPAFAQARAVTAARRDDYKKTFEIATDAWQKAFSLSIWNPMRSVFMAWSASVLTRVCHDCDLQRRMRDCEGLYPPGLLSDASLSNAYPQTNEWMRRFQKDDHVTIRGLYQWYHNDEEVVRSVRGDLEKVRKDAWLIMKANDIIGRTGEDAEHNVPPRESGIMSKTEKRAAQIVLDDLYCDISLELPITIWDRYHGPRISEDVLLKCLKKWVGELEEVGEWKSAGSQSLQSFKNGLNEGKILKTFPKEPKGAPDKSKPRYWRKKLLEIFQEQKLVHSTFDVDGGDQHQMIKQVLGNVQDAGKQNLWDVLIEIDFPGSAVKNNPSNIDFLFFRSFFRDKKNKTLSETEHRILKESWKKNDKGWHTTNYTKLVALFNFISVEFFRLIHADEDKQKKQKHMTLLQLEMRVFIMIRLFCKDWGEELDNDVKERTEVTSPNSWEDTRRKTKRRLDLYEKHVSMLITHSVSSSRKLLILLARMLNYRWYRINQTKTGWGNKNEGNQQKWGTIKSRVEGLLERIWEHIRQLHPISSAVGLETMQTKWFPELCGPRVGSKDGAINPIQLGVLKDADSSLHWLWHVSFNQVVANKATNEGGANWDRESHPGEFHRPLLMYPTPFGNPRIEERVE